jgi:hypothetical protein
MQKQFCMDMATFKGIIGCPLAYCLEFVRQLVVCRRPEAGKCPGNVDFHQDVAHV